MKLFARLEYMENNEIGEINVSPDVMIVDRSGSQRDEQTIKLRVVKARKLKKSGMFGKADPYVVLNLGTKRTSDKDNYISKQLNPVFGK